MLNYCKILKSDTVLNVLKKELSSINLNFFVSLVPPRLLAIYLHLHVFLTPILEK